MAVLAQDLRNSILQAAMQGQLTEQLDTDSDVKKWLEDCLKNKEILIKNKKIKKIAINEIELDDVPFNIPANWLWVRFGDIANLKIGKTPSRAEGKLWGNDIPWVSISDMTEKGHIVDTKEKISKCGFKESFNEEKTPIGTLIMSFKLTVGRVSILDIEATHNEAIISIFPYNDTKNYLRNYLFYTLSFLANYGKTKKAIKGFTLNSKSLNNLYIPIPPIEEQKRIVEKLEKILPQIDEYEKTEMKLEALKKEFPSDMKAAILQAAMQGKLTEQLETDSDVDEMLKKIKNSKPKKRADDLSEITADDMPFNIPENWRWVYLQDITKSINAGGDKPKDFSKDRTETCIYPVYSNGETNDGLFGFSSEKRIEEKAITVSGRGTIGFTRVREPNFTPIVRLLVLTFVDDTIDYDYICYVLNALLEHGNGSAVKQLTVPMIAPKLIPLPPIEEQQRIVEKLEQLLPLCEELI